jgi:DNA invertase Pin-like site-specific DNA recombinase
MRAVIYVRQSLDRDNDQLGIQRQEAECHSLCARRGWQVSRIISDNSVSAFKGQRAGYRELTGLIEANEVDVVVVYRLDRLMRGLTDLEALIELSERTGVQIATVQGDLDLTNSTGRLLGRILASVARSEVETKSERHKLANAQKAKAGKPHGSRRPYGYEADLMTIRESEAEVVRQMATRVISGRSYREVAWWLNKEGYRTTMGRTWKPITVRNLLAKKRYQGIIEYDGVQYPACYEPVLDHETSEALNMVMQFRIGRPAGARYLLTGLLHCGKCGTKLNGETKRDHKEAPLRRVYVCRSQGDEQKKHGCGGVRRGALPLEHFIREAVIYRLETPELARLLQNDQPGDVRVGELLERRAVLTRQQTYLEDDYAVGNVTRQQFKRMNTRNTEEASKIELELETLNRQRVSILPVGQSIREAWEDESTEWRRQLISLVVDKIIVKPGLLKPYYYVDGKRMRFDPGLVDVRWLV